MKFEILKLLFLKLFLETSLILSGRWYSNGKYAYLTVHILLPDRKIIFFFFSWINEKNLGMRMFPVYKILFWTSHLFPVSVQKCEIIFLALSAV